MAKRFVEVAFDTARLRMFALVIEEDAAVVVEKVEVPITVSVPESESEGRLRAERFNVWIFAV